MQYMFIIMAFRKSTVIFESSVTASAEGSIGHVLPVLQMGKPRQREIFFFFFSEVPC